MAIIRPYFPQAQIPIRCVVCGQLTTVTIEDARFGIADTLITLVHPQCRSMAYWSVKRGEVQDQEEGREDHK